MLNTKYLCLRIKITHFLIICICFTFCVTLLLAYFPMSNGYCKCELMHSIYDEQIVNEFHTTNEHKLAVLVPYRNRFEELLEFAPYLHNFLSKQHINHQIFILNQVDYFRFNRASLINVGYRFVKNNFDYIAIHDVDLLPLNPKLSYAYPEKQPYHVSSPELHPKYHYPTFVGGILLINREQFAQVNGMSNKYWGWGLEDDEFYVRLRDAGLNVTRPSGIKTGKTDTFKHIHDKSRKRDMTKCFNQREVTRKRDHQTGLNNVVFQIKAVKNMTVDRTPLILLNIQLFCNKNSTPWCDCGNTTEKETVKFEK